LPQAFKYCCREYIVILSKPDIQISMDQEAYLNLIAEWGNGVLKRWKKNTWREKALEMTLFLIILSKEFAFLRNYVAFTLFAS